MKRLLIASALACVLTGSAFAGEIPSGGIVPPPPPPGNSQMTSSTSPGSIPCDVAGEIPTGGFTQEAEDVLLGGFLAVMGWLT